MDWSSFIDPFIKRNQIPVFLKKKPYREEFTTKTKQEALARQKNKCGSCGNKITVLGEAGRSSHIFGERAEAHHMTHCQQGGTNELSNCVILDEHCHISVHEGANYRNNSPYLASFPSDYPYFHG